MHKVKQKAEFQLNVIYVFFCMDTHYLNNFIQQK